MMGDGATNQGTFSETMNLAALWKLPVVFVVVNNQFGMGTALHRHSAVTDLSLKAEGFGVPGTRCDGMDVLDVHKCVAEALRCAREERKPKLVEAVTYRYRGHSMADPEEYRTKEEVEEWRERDPIKAFAERLERGRARRRRTSSARRAGDRGGRRGGRVRRRVARSPTRLALRRHLRLRRAGPGLVSVDERTPEVHRGERRARGRRGAARAGRGGRRVRRGVERRRRTARTRTASDEAGGRGAEEDGAD